MSTLVDIGYHPNDLVNPNTMTDYGKFKRLINIFQLEDKLKETINEISEKGYIYSRLTRYVSVERIKWEDNFTSLLF